MEGRPFNIVFPNLNVSETLSHLLEDVVVDRVTLNPARDHLHVYITATNWIGKSHIYKLAKAITEQFFENSPMTVTVVEHFVLSASYNPMNFYDAYRPSMQKELEKTSRLLYQTYAHASVEFPDEHTIRVTLPDTIISVSRQQELRQYFEKVFCERAGFDLKVETRLSDEALPDHKEEDEAYIESRIRAVVERNAGRKEAAEEKVQKLPTKKAGSRAPRKFMPTADLILGKPFEDEPIPIAEVGNDPRTVTIRGEVFQTSSMETRSGRVIFTVAVTDYTDSLRMKFWLDPEELPDYESTFRSGNTFIFKGLMDYDPYDRELIIRQVWSVKKAGSIKKEREDNAPVKRVELHCHTTMSDMDAVSSATSIIRQAYTWGHKALAITDHGVVQAFPEALHTFGGKKGIPADADMKVIYGMEAYLVDDTRHLVAGADDRPVSAPMVVFSTVTTGRSPYKHHVIELAGIKVVDGKAAGEFKTLINPGCPIPFNAQKETGITDDQVVKAPDILTALRDFAAFAEGCFLTAFEADYEMSFLNAAIERARAASESATAENGTVSDAVDLPVLPATYVDIPSVLQYLMPQMTKLKFAKVCKDLKIPCTDEIRAYPRARCMMLVYQRLLENMAEAKIATLNDLDEKGRVDNQRIRNLPYYHAIILIKNEQGRRNLYKLVSESHLTYYKRRPRIPKTLLSELREGLVLGSACSAGELYRAILEGKSDAEIAAIVDYYDYLEIQPTANDQYLVREQRYGITSMEQLRDNTRRIVKLGEQFHKPVCATCDVHFLNPEDEIYRRIIQVGHGYPDEEQPPLYLRTTEEMLKEFEFLGDKKAYEVVVENTNLIADGLEKISPIHPDKCPPEIPHSEEDLTEMCYNKAHRMYGDPLPPIVENRLKKELDSICKNGYAVMYMIAQKLVAKSLSDGYLVGSRGSVGSSFVATMADITEVNPLPPHYYCPECFYSDFDSEEVRSYAGGAGCDMPDKICPGCGRPLKKDGFDIPFETFLGFKGDKEPDIDLNFSGDEQGIAQAYTEVIFGKGQTFKAGTIGTVADKTAYGYARHYFEDRDEPKRPCELERLSAGCVGVRRTTGQHPGGVIVVPKGMDINWFTPVQHPANDVNSDIITTHFDYHSIDKNLLKLDILGHDDPTMIRMLQDLTGVDPFAVPLDDPGVISLFKGTEALGIRPEDMGGVDLGTLGIPEFGTNFVMGMLRDTRPSSFSELVRISGLSHGTDVWLGNAQEYIAKGDCTLSTAICTRDDIMLNLIQWGVEASHAFTIMEAVRKGKGLKPEQEAEMREHNVPEWYIESCKKIKYMFPKAHAAAYVMNAWRIAYFKVNYPLAYYAAYFSIRSKTFSYVLMCQGREVLDGHIADYTKRKNELTANEADTLRDMLLVREMYARGFTFHKLDIYKAHALNFSIIDGKLMPALNTINGLGDAQAEQLEKEAARGRFLSKDDLKNRGKVSRTIIETFEELGIISDIPETNQFSLFDRM
ncbi:MAG: PolC-type DNA polymerase III [Lachnospiraceae bacterium]|nr:PolC-type DNA polymerase III [Lachnospiraceae bacterium]